jgi:HEAT repeat protein
MKKQIKLILILSCLFMMVVIHSGNLVFGQQGSLSIKEIGEKIRSAQPGSQERRDFLFNLDKICSKQKIYTKEEIDLLTSFFDLDDIEVKEMCLSICFDTKTKQIVQPALKIYLDKNNSIEFRSRAFRLLSLFAGNNPEAELANSELNNLVNYGDKDAIEINKDYVSIPWLSWNEDYNTKKEKAKREKLEKKKVLNGSEYDYKTWDIEQIVNELRGTDKQIQKTKFEELRHALIIKRKITNKENQILINLLKDPNQELQTAAKLICVEQKNDDAVGPLTENIMDEKKSIEERNDASEALEKIGSEKATKALIEIMIKSLKEESLPPNYDIFEGFTLLTDTRAIPILVKYLDYKNRWVRASVASTLGNIGSSIAISSLLNELNKENDDIVKLKIASALCKLSNPEGANTILKLLEESEVNYLYTIDDLYNLLLEESKLFFPDKLVLIKTSDEKEKLKGFMSFYYILCRHDSLMYKIGLKGEIISSLRLIHNKESEDILIKMFNKEKNKYMKISIALALLVHDNKQGMQTIIESINDESELVGSITMAILWVRDRNTLWKYAPEKWKKEWRGTEPEFK